jgi:heterotetrameric sarcosine oxidase gamma subunit
VRLEPRSALGGQFGDASDIAEIADLAVCERADFGCLLVTAAIASADIGEKASAAIGVELPSSAGTVITHGGRVAVWFSPQSWLILCGLEDEMGVVARVNAAFPDKLVHATPFTDSLCWFELRGSRAETLLQKGGPISLERGGLAVGRAKRTLIAGITAIIIHKEEDAWHVGIERSRARYFSEWLMSGEV